MDGTPEERFAAIVAAHEADPDVDQCTGFGSMPGLRAGGRIFAMLVRGRLVVKLTPDRVDALVAAGGAERFDPGHGRRMKAWASVEPGAPQDWAALAAEARALLDAG
jgi:hypothetical protein